MTQPQTLNVEYEELMARADEIDAPLPAIPSTNPGGPCSLLFVDNAATQLGLSADSVRLYLEACQREWHILAESLRNAAKAYEEVDEGAAEAINDDSSDSALTAASVGEGDDADEPLDLDVTDSASVDDPDDGYYDVKEAAAIIEAGDQGAAFAAFALEWDDFQRALQEETYRFRPFSSWEGDSRAIVEANFEEQRQWIYSMAQSCLDLANQANTVVDAHNTAVANSQTATTDEEHPTSYEVSQVEWWYARYVAEGNADGKYHALEAYEKMQQESETALSYYKQNAALPLSPVKPEVPPTATVINSPGDGSGDLDINDLLDGLSGADLASDGISGDALAGNGAGLPSALSGGSDDETPTDELTDEPTNALTGTPAGRGLSTGGSGLKPASFGGGGVGGVSMPTMPLQPTLEPESSRPAAAVPGAAGVGRGMPGLGGAMGGSGMGGVPMSPGGQGQGQNAKAKRPLGGDDALYVEKRAWTSSVIGNRRRSDAPDGEEASAAKTA